MKMSGAGLIDTGLVGLTLTSTLAGRGEYVIKLGPLRFDLYLAALGGFGFLIAWGLLAIVGSTHEFLRHYHRVGRIGITIHQPIA